LNKIMLLGIAALAALGLMMTGCNEEGAGAGAAPDGSPVLVTVNGGSITSDEFKAEAAALSPYAGQMLADEETRKKFLDNLVSKELLIQDARKAGYDKDPEVLKRLNEVMDNLLLGLYVKKEIFDKAAITDEQLKEYFDKNKDVLGSARVNHIQVGSKEEAEEVLIKYKSGTSFNALAKEYSQDANTKNSGGDLGFLDWSQFGSPDLREAAFNTPLGEVGNIIRSSFAFHVIKVTDRKPAKDEDFEKLKEDIREYLLEKDKEKLFEDRVAQLKSAANISIDDEAVKELSLIGLAGEPQTLGQ